MPHGVCLLWKPEVLYLHIISDVFIGLAYYSIASALIYFIYRREDIAFRWFFVTFVVLIFGTCGTTHFMAVWTLWYPDYAVSGLIKAVTALASLITGTLIWWLLPQMLKLPSPSQLESKNIELQQEIEEREKAEQAVNQFKTTLDLTLDCVFIFTTDSLKFFYVNEGATEQVGFTYSELMEKTPLDLQPEFKEIEFRNLLSSLSHGQQRAIKLESIHKHKNGNHLPVEMILQYIAPEGESPRYIALSRDISERKQREEELQQAKNEAELATQAKSDFLSNMSHEIRTPMNAVIGMSHLALQTQLTDKQQDYLNKIQSSAHALLGIINDILDFSKIEAGKMSMEKVDFQLENVFENISNMMAAKAEEKKLEIIFPSGSDIPKALIGDPLRLGQVLINLIGNSFKFTPEGGEVVVRTELLSRSTEHAKFRFSVHDTGIGMSEEQVSKLFQAFTQADASTTRKYGGTGLGLSISKALVEMMNGKIWVTSELDKGSTFFFNAEFGISSKDQELKRTIIAPPDLRDRRILVVDDSATSREMLCELLRSFSFNSFSVASGQAALAELERIGQDPEERPYDLVLMDWKMPSMNGLEATRRIRTEISLPSLPTVIMVTAFGREEVMAEADEVGLKGFLIKPVNPSVLFDAIMQAFGREIVSSHQSAKPQHTRDVEAIKGILGAEILLTEDNEINQQVARELLESYGLKVTIVNNGIQAVEAVHQKEFDLVFMDIQMPEMDGYQATRQIRKEQRFKSLPVLAMTAHAMAGAKEKCLAAGMDGYISKPIAPELLFESLVKWIKPKDRGGCLPEQQKPQPVEETIYLPQVVAGIDIEEGLRKLLGNRSLYHKLLMVFHREFKNIVLEIKTALLENDLELAERLIHTCKGTASNIGATTIFETARELEAVVENGGTYHKGPLGKFEDALNVVLDSTSEIIDKAHEVRDNQTKGDKTDISALEPLFQDLAILLEEGSPQAAESLAIIRQYIGEALQKEYTQLEEQIENFELEEALETLLNMASSLNITIAGDADAG